MKRSLLSAFVIVTLMASVIVGAIGVSVDYASADDPIGYTGYFDDLVAQAREDCNANYYSYFDTYTDYMKNNFDSIYIVVIHDEDTRDWYFGSYVPNNNCTSCVWTSWNGNNYDAFMSYNGNNGYAASGLFAQYCFKFSGDTFTQSSYLHKSIDSFRVNALSYTNSWMYYAPCPTYTNVSGRMVYCNQDLFVYHSQYYLEEYLLANLVEGSYIPPIFEFDYFKFNLGDRWYLTTNDQIYVNRMRQYDETFYDWQLQVRYADGMPDFLYVESPDMVYIPYAENFITQTVTNISEEGIYAFDITSWIQDDDFVAIEGSKFLEYNLQTFQYTERGVSEDVVSLILNPDQEDPARNEAWTIINNYIENYPSVTISPAVLASQLSGQTAIAGGMGWLQVPSAMYDWAVNTNRINDYDHSLTDDFEFRLNSESLSPTEMSLINYDILDAVVLAADAVGSVTDPYLHYWMAENSLSAYFVDRMSYQECLDSFDIILIVKNNSWYLGNVYDNLSAPDFALTQGTYSYTNLHKNQLMPVPSNTAIDNSVYYCYWILTPRAIQKSQLFAFCDGFHKLYDLASAYVQKKDLWDNSFFEWSMSVFYQLESINGYLSNVQSKLDTVISSLQRLEQNTSETDVEPWFLSLLNWVRRFPVTDLDFVSWVNNYDNFQDSLEYPETTVIPLPTSVPTSAVGG